MVVAHRCISLNHYRGGLSRPPESGRFKLGFLGAEARARIGLSLYTGQTGAVDCALDNFESISCKNQCIKKICSITLPPVRRELPWPTL